MKKNVTLFGSDIAIKCQSRSSHSFFKFNSLNIWNS